MDAGHVILGRSWLFDMDVTLWEKSNTCTFNYKGQRIKLIPSQLKSKQEEKKSVDTRKEKNLNLISPKEIEKKVISEVQIIILVAREVAENLMRRFFLKWPSYHRFCWCVSQRPPGSMSLMRKIQHAIDLVSGTTLPNLLHYRTRWNMPNYKGKLKSCWAEGSYARVWSLARFPHC